MLISMLLGRSRGRGDRNIVQKIYDPQQFLAASSHSHCSRLSYNY